MSHDDGRLRDEITDVVAFVILETGGRIVRPAPDQELFDGLLDEFEAGRLYLALNERFGLELQGALQPRTIGTVARIEALVRRE